ncbi:uncharacterized protein LOC143175074 isoform X2 [Nomia melanderi]|uniref:uncharacterized protein LOC143175074 isoform X2 n=1 Tax=Nomia melanderi TaxID=2448451 RepID=UPI003FCCADB7
MDVFQKNYRAYYSVMYITGLWPYDNSIVTKIKRVGFCVLALSSIVIQASTIRTVETTLENVLVLLSFLFPTVLFFLRYVGYLSNFPVLKVGFENIQNDCMRLKDPIEADLLMKEIAQSRRVIRILVVLTCMAVLLINAMLLLPTVLQSKFQIRYLKILGIFFNHRGRKVDFVCCNVALVTSVGVLSLSCTEAIPTVFGCYISGLFQIASYRLENAINRSTKSDRPIEIDVRSTVEIHQRALELNEQLTSNMMLSYLAAIITVVLSFAVNLYRVYLVLQNNHEIDNVFITLQIFLVHVMIMLLNNYSGQRLINNSVDFFHNTYNTLWYCIPLRSQKLLMFIMMRSISEVKFNLAGLFTPCYEGFTTMMSSSFSYFTVISSV